MSCPACLWQMSDSEDGPFSNQLPAPPIALERPAQRPRLGERPEGLSEPVDKLAYHPVLYAAADEIKDVGSESVKAWCGSGEIVARGLYKDTEEFPAKFNLVEITSGNIITLQKDPGLERRCCAIRFSTRFIPCKNEEEGVPAAVHAC